MIQIHEPVHALENDDLGRAELGRHLLKKIMAPECPPAIGLYGGWGTGKTSLINLLAVLHQGQMEVYPPPERSLLFLVVGAWKYDGTHNLFIPVIGKLKNLLPKDRSAQAGIHVKRLLVATGLSLMNASMQKVLGYGIEESEGLQKRSEDLVSGDPELKMLDAWSRLADETEEANLEFQEVVRRVLEAQKKDRLVICVDNLDRCTPDMVIRLLESAKNFLMVPNCVWVFAMDSSVVTRFIRAKFGEVDGYTYLDKIIPEQFHIPLPSPLNDRQAIETLLQKTVPPGLNYSIPVSWEDYAQIQRVMAPRRLIKSACKYGELFEQGDGLSSPSDLAFQMILLYHGWPDFYAWLSCSNLVHIQKTFDRFSEPPMGSYPIPADFLDDQELRHFLQAVLLPRIERENNSSETILTVMQELRRVGLP